MRPRWQVALLLLTMPLWIIPGLLYVGWMETGRNLIYDIRIGVPWVLFGKKP